MELSARKRASVLIVLFLGTYLSVGFRHDERFFPFSSFPMYSGARTKAPMQQTRYAIVGTTISGAEVRDLQPPMGMSLFLNWQKQLRLRPNAQKWLGRFAWKHIQLSRGAQEEPLSSVRLVQIRYEIPYPHPEEVRKLWEKTLVDIRR